MAAEDTINPEELASRSEAASPAEEAGPLDFGELSRAASGSAEAPGHADPGKSARKTPKRRKKAAKKKASRKRKKASRKPAGKKASRKKKTSAGQTAAQAEIREPADFGPLGETGSRAVEAMENEAAAVVETHEDAVEESVPACAAEAAPSRTSASSVEPRRPVPAEADPVAGEDTGPGRLSLEILGNNETPVEIETETEVATNAAPEPIPSEPTAERVPSGPAPEPVPGGPTTEPEDDAEAEAPRAPEEARTRAPDPGETSPEELSPEQALAMLAEISGRSPKVGATPTAAGRLRRPRPPGSVVMPSCRVIAFESDAVPGEMRVAGSTVARLYGMIHREGLDLELGRVCRTLDDLIGAWDSTPLGQTIILLVNLIGAEGFLEEFFSEVPEVPEAYWIVYETLRGEVTSSKHGFLAEQRAKRRAKAIGFGPRNVLDAARSAAEAVRWHVQWGFAGRFAARAG